MSSAATPPRLAVVTVTHNSGHVIERWVEALEKTGRRAEMELCVVDSGSTAREREFLNGPIRDRVDVITERPNIGYGQSGNVGAAHTTAPVLMFTNPDTRVLAVPEDLEGVTERRIAGAWKRFPDGHRAPLGFAELPSTWLEARKLVLGRWQPTIARTSEDPAWASGAAVLVSRADFVRLGGFSPELFMYFEDADLCARHREGGGSVVIDPGFVVEHDSGMSSAVEHPAGLESAKDSVSRLSARIFATRHGRRWHRPLLYALMVFAYVPRRAARVALGRRGGALSCARDLVAPRRVLRRLGVPDARRAGH